MARRRLPVWLAARFDEPFAARIARWTAMQPGDPPRGSDDWYRLVQRRVVASWAEDEPYWRAMVEWLRAGISPGNSGE